MGVLGAVIVGSVLFSQPDLIWICCGEVGVGLAEGLEGDGAEGLRRE